ncbi:MAG: Gfo/Idh/MocA family oxidoreductase [Proteobacteria bacterium]|nr:Gfo/Idh/MocA family oxidoreductase [Pseudomonadota bacterium]MBI3498145.1 Gfo/Idh/MocA family oxidoreductase [Pseudomonadota bacterium]
MPRSHPIRVGIIGMGQFGRLHAKALGELGGRARLAAVASGSFAEAERVAADLGAKAYRDWRAVLAEVDAVCIATPHDLHGEMTLAAIEAGCAVLLEKPMAPSLAQCDAILDGLRGRPVPFTVAQPTRFIPAYAEAVARIRSGVIGEPIHVRAPMIKDFTLKARKDWHLAQTRGGGMWMTNAVHLVDRLVLAFGRMPMSVSASLGTGFHTGLAVDDIGVALYRFWGGGTGIAEAAGYRVGAPDHWTVIVGTEGALRCEPGLGLELGRDNAWQTAFAADPAWLAKALAAEWTSFLDHVEGGPSPVSALEGRNVMAAVIAAEEAAAENAVVRVPLRE